LFSAKTGWAQHVFRCVNRDTTLASEDRGRNDRYEVFAYAKASGVQHPEKRLFL